jgi:hypothetical protein
MRPSGRSVSAALALLIFAAVGTVLLRGRSAHMPARLETPGTVQSADLLELQCKNLAGPEAVDCARVRAWFSMGPVPKKVGIAVIAVRLRAR